MRCFIDGESRNIHPNSERENVKTLDVCTLDKHQILWWLISDLGTIFSYYSSCVLSSLKACASGSIAAGEGLQPAVTCSRRNSITAPASCASSSYCTGLSLCTQHSSTHAHTRTYTSPYIREHHTRKMPSDQERVGSCSIALIPVPRTECNRGGEEGRRERRKGNVPQACI